MSSRCAPATGSCRKSLARCLGTLALLLCAPASWAEQHSASRCGLASAEPTLTAHLLFGARRGDGGLVTTAAWKRFLDTRLTPLFPAGLTVLDGRGQWRRRDGRLLREPVRVVLIVAPETSEVLAALEAARLAYKTAFAQQAVGLVVSRSCSAF